MGWSAICPCRDFHQWDLPIDLHWAVEEDGQKVHGEVQDALLGLVEVTDQAEVDGLVIVVLADRPNVQILGKSLPWLMVFGQLVTGSRSRQGISQGAQFLFHFQIRL